MADILVLRTVRSILFIGIPNPEYLKKTPDLPHVGITDKHLSHKVISSTH